MSAVACVLGHTGSERAEGGGSSGAEGRRGLMVMLHSRLRHGSTSAHVRCPPRRLQCCTARVAGASASHLQRSTLQVVPPYKQPPALSAACIA